MYEEIKKIAETLGFEECKEIPARLIPCDPSLRRFCEQNLCGMYHASYMCPPAMGNAKALIAQLHNFKDALIFTKEYQIADLTCQEGYLGQQIAHERRSQLLWKSMQKIGLDSKNARVLAAGGCHLCEECGIKTGEPCRHPDTAIHSVSGYCIEVAKLSKTLGIDFVGKNGGVVFYTFVLLK